MFYSGSGTIKSQGDIYYNIIVKSLPYMQSISAKLSASCGSINPASTSDL